MDLVDDIIASELKAGDEEWHKAVVPAEKNPTQSYTEIWVRGRIEDLKWMGFTELIAVKLKRAGTLDFRGRRKGTVLSCEIGVFDGREFTNKGFYIPGDFPLDLQKVRRKPPEEYWKELSNGRTQ